MTKALRLGTLVVLLTALVAGCGVRGSLERPGGGDPDEKATAKSAAEEQNRDKSQPAPPKQHKGFILDGLL